RDEIGVRRGWMRCLHSCTWPRWLREVLASTHNFILIFFPGGLAIQSDHEENIPRFGECLLGACRQCGWEACHHDRGYRGFEEPASCPGEDCEMARIAVRFLHARYCYGMPPSFHFKFIALMEILEFICASTK